MTEPSSASANSRAARAHDLVIFGATGFTGQLVAEYLVKNRPAGLRWALAGRNPQKLEQVRSRLAALDGALAGLPILLGDSEDEVALRRIAQSTRVVCTTAGPFDRFGRKLLAACADAGTHYCDITGEVPFIRWAIDHHHARAQATGARIVPTCGFDSLPSDLGVQMLAEHFQEQGEKLASATLSVERTQGAFSGGTIASMLNLLEAAGRDRELRRLLADPYALNPDRTQDRGPETGDSLAISWDAELQRWTAPFVMGAINTRVVRRTNALLGYPYGRDFRYRELMSFKRGPKGLVMATAVLGGIVVFAGLASGSATRRLISRWLPAPGEGPSLAERQAGSFRIRIVGQSQADAQGFVLRAQARIEADGDPGYSETAKMLAESALCLAFDDLPAGGGVLTPAACMGAQLVARLRRKAMVWTVEAG